MPTPDSTLILVTPENSRAITADQVASMGALGHCRSSNRTRLRPGPNTDKKPATRSFSITKILPDIAHDGRLETNLMFARRNGFRCSPDPCYSNQRVSSEKHLCQRIGTGR